MSTIFFSVALLLISTKVESSIANNQAHTHQVFEVTKPLPSDYLPPSCTHTILRHSFTGDPPPPFTTPYSPPPPNCPSPWSFVTLELHVTSVGPGDYTRHHIAGLWLSGAEILRTSAPEPNKCGFFWKIRKDVSVYSSIFVKRNVDLTMVIENGAVSSNANGRTGTYNVEIKLFFYNAASAPLNGVYETAPNLIMPFGEEAKGGRGFWFKVESKLDLKVNRIEIPPNTRKAVIELYASFHGNDEFWYTNPPNSYLIMNNLTDVGGNGAFRELFITIDGELAGSEVPFPVIFNGGLNPLFWQRVVGIGAFHLPCYKFEITPLLGKVLDRKRHEFGVGVNDATSYWLVGANLQLWLDSGSGKVSAGIQPLINPSISVKRREIFKLLDGIFTIKAKRKNKYMGWVQSSSGNLTTVISLDYKFRNTVTISNNGNLKTVKQTITLIKQVQVYIGNDKNLLSNTIVRKRYPLNLSVLSLPFFRKKRSPLLVLTNVSHGLTERCSNGEFTSILVNSQDSRGWLDVNRRNGEAITKQSLSYRDLQRCYVRFVEADDRVLVIDYSSFSCPSVYAT